ncbi:MAG: VPLPA-CTERM sorting domain-containing protein [Pseudomonadota bacterium]
MTIAVRPRHARAALFAAALVAIPAAAGATPIASPEALNALAAGLDRDDDGFVNDGAPVFGSPLLSPYLGPDEDCDDTRPAVRPGLGGCPAPGGATWGGATLGDYVIGAGLTLTLDDLGGDSALLVLGDASGETFEVVAGPNAVSSGEFRLTEPGTYYALIVSGRETGGEADLRAGVQVYSFEAVEGGVGASVPLPAALPLLGVGLAVLGIAARRRR